jgi:hypothetical protein
MVEIGETAKEDRARGICWVPVGVRGLEMNQKSERFNNSQISEN